MTLQCHLNIDESSLIQIDKPKGINSFSESDIIIEKCVMILVLFKADIANMYIHIHCMTKRFSTLDCHSNMWVFPKPLFCNCIGCLLL